MKEEILEDQLNEWEKRETWKGSLRRNVSQKTFMKVKKQMFDQKKYGPIKDIEGGKVYSSQLMHENYSKYSISIGIKENPIT